MRGLINVQFAVQGPDVYALEANPARHAQRRSLEGNRRERWWTPPAGRPGLEVVVRSR